MNMFSLKQVSLIFEISILSAFAVAQDATTWGPTVDPNYVRQEGKKSIECPSTHPYALNNGQSCCSKLIRDPGCAETGRLQFEDDSNCCAGSNTLACPADADDTTGVCKSRKLDLSMADTCAISNGNAFYYGSKCCETVMRSDNCSAIASDGKVLLQMDDLEECCKPEHTVDCGSVFPCKPFLGCVTKSYNVMTHSDAMDYCESKGYLNMDITTLTGFNSIYEVFEEDMINGTHMVWMNMPYIGSDASSLVCRDADCDGYFNFDDGSTPYDFAQSGIRLTHVLTNTGCLASRYDPVEEEPLIVAAPCGDLNYAWCRCSPSH